MPSLHFEFDHFTSVLSAASSQSLVMTDQQGMDHKELLEKVLKYEDEITVSNLRLQKSVFELKTELRKGIGALQSQLESACREVKDKVSDLETEKRRVVELETKLADASWQAQNQIKLARGEIEALKAELTSERKQVATLEESNSRYRSQQDSLEASIRELKTLHASLEHKLTQCEAEKIQVKKSCDGQEIQLRLFKRGAGSFRNLGMQEEDNKLR